MTSRTDIASLLDRIFAGEEAQAEEVAVVATALSSDADARAYYDGIARVDAELGGDFEARFGEAWFLAGLDEMLAEEAHVPVAANDNRPWTMWLAVAAMALLSFAGLLSHHTQPDEFAARSAAMPGPARYAPSELAVYCVSRDGGEPRFASARDFEFGTVRCAQDAEIKLAARTQDRRLRWGAFFGVDTTGTIHWYGPSPAQPAAVAIERAEVVRPVGETIRLEVNHQPGTVRVVGIFAEERLEWSDVELIVRRNATQLRDGDVVLHRASIVRQTFEVAKR